MRTKLNKMFKGNLDDYTLRCADCGMEYKPVQLAAARAHQNFKGHTLVVYHVLEGGIGPLFTFMKIRG